MKKIFVFCIFVLLMFAIFASGCTSNNDTQPVNKYQPGDVISVYASVTVHTPYGWVITRYESDEDLYYGFKVENRDGIWGLTSTKEYDLWSKETTEKDFPYVLGHMNLNGAEDKWNQPIYYD
ncbi:MAG: hypothetical protein RBQ80_05225 [Methanocorpusculum sp.]|jgi:hypothetical protein|nr:hypothetical protein [Methanocorpusculum sp.]